MGNSMKKRKGTNPQPVVVGQPPVSQQVPVQQSALSLQPHPVVIAAHLPPAAAQNEPSPQQFSQPAMVAQEPQQPVMFAQEPQQPVMMPQQQPFMYSQEPQQQPMMMAQEPQQPFMFAQEPQQQPMMMNQPQPAMIAPQQNFMTPIATQ